MGLKPIGGRISLACSNEVNFADEILETWNNLKAQRLVTDWKEEYMER